MLTMMIQTMMDIFTRNVPTNKHAHNHDWAHGGAFKSSAIPLDDELVSDCSLWEEVTSLCVEPSILGFGGASSPPSSVPLALAETSHYLDGTTEQQLAEGIESRTDKRGKNARFLIPAGLEPGDGVCVLHPDGTIVQRVVPHRSTWRYRTSCDGASRAFVAAGDLPAATVSRPSQDECAHYHQSETKKVRFSFFDEESSICQCTPSRRDSMCPFHGAGPRRQC